MARQPRYAAPGQPQHVIQRGNNRSAIFAADADCRAYRDYLRDACVEHGCEVNAYVFMTNHVHLLMTPGSATAISRVMQALGRLYVRRFNSAYRRTGTLWEGRYRATVIDTNHYLFTCYRYIELNPVRAGLVADPGDYVWSSYRANAFGSFDPLVTRHARYCALGIDASACQAAYRALFGEDLSDATLEQIRDATQRGWVLGSKRFREEISLLLKRRTEPAVRGRRPRGKDEI